jgi:CDP-diacylglycerol--glycerol-3-phosphate 3-phosphatidyltransferase
MGRLDVVGVFGYSDEDGTEAEVALSTIALVPWWITVLILVREWGVTAVRFWVIRHGVMAAGRGGKLKTMLQAMALGLYILPLDLLPLASVTTVIAFVLLLAALAVTAVTGVDYVIDALRLRQTSERAAMKRARRAGQGES